MIESLRRRILPMATLRVAGLLLLLSAIAGVIASAFHPELCDGPTPPLAPHETSVTAARAWGSGVLWIDARGDKPFAQGHIPGALSFDPADWEQRLVQLLEKWQPGVKVIVYCDAAGCDTSKQIAARLRDEVGLPDVYFLRGGWEAWQAQRP
jgi:rhodanese-related sulfurtransferase